MALACCDFVVDSSPSLAANSSTDSDQVNDATDSDHVSKKSVNYDPISDRSGAHRCTMQKSVRTFSEYFTLIKSNQFTLFAATFRGTLFATVQTDIDHARLTLLHLTLIRMKIGSLYIANPPRSADFSLV